MAKISFLQAPTFKVDVEMPRLGSTPVKVSVTYHHLNRDQLAELADSDIAYTREMKDLTQSEEASVADVTGKAKEHQLVQLKRVVAGWGFAEELNDENLQALVDHSAETAVAILSAFRTSYEKAREGNLKA
ncbi:phage tail assembly chaperone [Pseudomonas sp. DTU_2021_1001937_2_SI_NGA_ILE_001]|uniref:phage tail assembly chaperone n=1 Tax=Pseudomonas sp. DTU_2021_1001937_2_SI_NGA_ILE_001 TaxID=3077589 RepID=UPI0028FC223B|nr:phage tail assembly chaperone [Pseudomonas sp. DTU_2021_1001937_2_SI_NGA_ILE_001]WNW10130.1 phage tail assembly chaperone [Pseudomonas sp. DTU_2021_1001937_2_SI_NGA_ILE_001]